MNIKGKMMMLFGAMVCVMSASSCSDSKSYAEQLADERVATNLFLSQQRVVNEIPADTIFAEMMRTTTRRAMAMNMFIAEVPLSQ